MADENVIIIKRSKSWKISCKATIRSCAREGEARWFARLLNEAYAHGKAEGMGLKVELNADIMPIANGQRISYD